MSNSQIESLKIEISQAMKKGEVRKMVDLNLQLRKAEDDYQIVQRKLREMSASRKHSGLSSFDKK